MRRRSLVFLGLPLILSCLGLATGGEERFSGRTAWEISRKMTCGTLEEGVVRYGIFEGRAYSRTAAEKDRHLFNVLGVNTRWCRSLRDEAKGEGFRSVSREVMLYLDPETGSVLDEWTNPWTGKTVEVLHVENDPVNMRAPLWESAAREVRLRRYGDLLYSSEEVPLFYPNPLGGEFQRLIGGMYHAMEIFNSSYRASELLGKQPALGRSWIAWTRVSQWLPWMEMGDLPGLMIFNATGTSTFDREEIPEPLRSVLRERYPAYFTPPPLDDSRPNETSWTVFRDRVRSREQGQEKPER